MTFRQHDDLRRLAASGAGRTDMVLALGISYPTLLKWSRVLGIALPKRGAGGPRTPLPPRRNRSPNARSLQMAAMYRGGATLAQIGAYYSVTRERVRQILARDYGYDGSSGGLRRRAAERRQQRDAEQNARYIKRYGCGYAEYVALRGSITRKFSMQRSNAYRRGIGWELSLAEWWRVWKESGRWEQRGRGQGYVMCRFGDDGPYAVGNVFIALARENSSKTKQKKSSLPMGVTRIKRGNYIAFVAHRTIHGKAAYLGSFKTPEDAHAAYQAASMERAA